MARPPRGGKPASPLDAKQQALGEEEAQLREKVSRLQRLIEEAPRLAEEEERRRREELISRASQGAARWESRAVIPDKRFDAHTSLYRPSRRSLKSEKAEVRRKFFVLCIVLGALALWVWSIIN